MSLIQLIEICTTRIEEIEELITRWAATTEGKRQTQRGTLTQDRDRPSTYLQIVEFPSHAAATANSELPETGDFARQLAELCDAPPVFRDLDVRQTFDLR